jgi:hypothetical protein
MKSKYRRAKSAFVFMALAGPASGVAGDAWDVHPHLADKYNVGFGVFFPERSFSIGVDGSLPGISRDIDFSERVKLEDTETTEGLELGWRFGKKWLVRGQYFSVGGERSATLDEDVQWGDYTFGAGTGVTAGIDLSIARLFFGYTIRRDDVHEFGVGGGVHRLDIGAFISGQAIINNNPPASASLSASTTGPLPNIGGWYIRSLSRRWAMTARVDWLSANIDKYDGQIVNASLGVNFAMTRHFGIGLSYNYFEVDIGIKEKNWNGDAEISVNGPFAYLTASW